MGKEDNKIMENPIQSPDVLIRKLNELTYVYIGKSNVLYELNEAAALIWELCNGNNNLDEIASAIAQAVHMPTDEIKRDVEETVATLAQLGLLAGNEDHHDTESAHSKNNE